MDSGNPFSWTDIKSDEEIMFHTVNYLIVLFHFITWEAKARFPQFSVQKLFRTLSNIYHQKQLLSILRNF